MYYFTFAICTYASTGNPTHLQKIKAFGEMTLRGFQNGEVPVAQSLVLKATEGGDHFYCSQLCCMVVKHGLLH